MLAGIDTEWTLPAEPYEYDLKEIYGKDALKGYGWINKLVFVHCSRLRICWRFEMQHENDYFRTIDKECYPAYLDDKKKFKRTEYLKINNNQAYFVLNDEEKMLTYNWSKLPIKIIND